MAVVCSFEHDDLVATRESAGHSDGGHRRFRARIDEPEQIDAREPSLHLLGQEDLRFRGGSEAHATARSTVDRSDDRGIGVTE